MRDSLTCAKFLLLAVLCVVWPDMRVLADTIEDSLGECARIPGSFKRLDCYDSVVRDQGLSEESDGGTAAGKWRVQQRDSGLREDADVYMILHAVENIPGDDGEVRPMLVVRCEENNTAVIFNFARFIEKSRADAALRFDDGAVITARMKMSASGKAFGFWQGDEAIPFARRLLTGKRLMVQVTPFGARPVLAEFAIEGFAEAAEPLRKACDW